MVFHRVIDISEEQAEIEIDLYLKASFGDMTWGEYKQKIKDLTDKMK